VAGARIVPWWVTRTLFTREYQNFVAEWDCESVILQIKLINMLVDSKCKKKTTTKNKAKGWLKVIHELVNEAFSSQ